MPLALRLDDSGKSLHRPASMIGVRKSRCRVGSCLQRLKPLANAGTESLREVVLQRVADQVRIRAQSKLLQQAGAKGVDGFRADVQLRRNV